MGSHNIGTYNHPYNWFPGQISIGGFNPREKLTVSGTVSAQKYKGQWIGDTLSGQYISVEGYDIKSSHIPQGYFLRAGTRTGTWEPLNSIANDFTFYGKVGIGTDSPTEKLTVAGNISASDTITADTIIAKTLLSATNLDITYELSGFSVTGDISASGGLSAYNGYFVDKVGIGTNAPDYELDVAGDIGVNQYIYHNGDSNTHINFTDDDINIQVGGINMIDLTEGASDEITFNEAAADLDFRVEGEDDPNLLFTDATTPGRVGIGTKTPNEKLTVAGNISAIGSLSGTNVNASSTSRGFVSAGRDLADIFATSSGNVDGSGTACYLSVWSDTDTLGNSIACQSASVLTVSGSISANGTITAEDGEIKDYLQAGRLTVNSAGLGSHDFRVEGTSTQYLIFADASCNNVGIGTAAATEKLTVGGNISARDGLSATGANNYFSGNVGIGTNAPDYALDVAGNIGMDEYLYHNGDGDTYLRLRTDRVNLVAGGKSAIYYCSGDGKIIINNSNEDVDFHVMAEDNSEILATDAANNRVGINTTAPTEALTINGNLTATGGLTTAGGLSVINTLSANNYFAGSVGIGTTAPETPFHVVAPAVASTSELVAKFSVSDDTSSYVGIGNNTSSNNKFDPTITGVQDDSNRPGLQIIGSLNADTTTSWVGGVNFQAKKGASSAVAASTKAFYFSNYGTYPTVMMGNGNWGFNTISPTEMVTINGNLTATGTLSAAGAIVTQNNVYGVKVCGGTAVCAPAVCGTTSVCGALVKGTNVCGTTSVCGGYICSTGNICAGSGVVYGGGCVCGSNVTDGYSCFDGSGSTCSCYFLAGSDICATGGTVCGYYGCFDYLYKSSGSFHIDHPLESKKDTHNLVHSFIEGPQADNIYSGSIKLTSGSATVNIDNCAGMTDGTFVALNRCIRAFTTNETNWDPVKGSVAGNVLTVESCVPDSTADVSWMVIGERQDVAMTNPGNPMTDSGGHIIVEPEKPPLEGDE